MSETRSAESATSKDGDQVEELRAQLELVQSENERLRTEYRRAKQVGYRRTALGLGIVGIVAVLGGVLFPAAREVLFVLGAIGVFGGVLTRYLTPGRFVAAETGERVYAAQAETLGALSGQLGLEETAVYVPIDGEPPARLFIPQHAEYSIPDQSTLQQPLVLGKQTDERGASLVPTGGTLFREFEQSLTGSLGDDPSTVAEQVADSLVEGFELAETTDLSIDAAAGRVTVAVEGAVYSDSAALDNPLGSLLAVGLAEALSHPVELETTTSGDELVLTCRWETEATPVDDASK
jgi:hypothetical protein